ncbi:hypothetical protein MKK64_19125 [Methylobacterium sp. E-025]|uniref:hypothetical protein n=1 Tax=Methylobacterium sp. E-025 TaxID=2836561 RepID=UPI001FBB2991|nr:hypothetical protein [Methylobacterium sp. E-025]MCJ2113292.1 hypothetical protein [Methylobacterium sp. E-025]
MTDAPLFEAAGVILEPVTTKTKRTRRPKPPTPAERAASGRLGGARRYRNTLGSACRVRIGPTRDLTHYRAVLSFPFSRNASLLQETVSKLPVEYDEKLDEAFSRERNKLESTLRRKGIPRKPARECANELVHSAYMIRAKAAWKKEELCHTP